MALLIRKTIEKTYILQIFLLRNNGRCFWARILVWYPYNSVQVCRIFYYTESGNVVTKSKERAQVRGRAPCALS
jgi:hypothetical protein